MDPKRELGQLKRLACDTARLAIGHPCMKLARHSMSVINRFGLADRAMWIDDVFENVETILADIEGVAR